MADAMQKVTYSEDPDILLILDGLAVRISERRGGAPVSRADVIRYCTRHIRDLFKDRGDSEALEILAACV